MTAFVNVGLADAELAPAPFPHVIVNGLFPSLQLRDVLAEFPHPDDPRWRRYANNNEAKLEGPEPMWGLATRDLFEHTSMLAPQLGDLFGIPDLSMETVGGGYHLIPPGGRLEVHTDFSRSPATGMYRRLNMLTYLNRDWADPGGRLELWPDGDGDPVVVAPELGRTLIFATSSKSWHGHPKPAARWRASVAAYFFSPEPPDGFQEQSTVWRKDRHG